MAGIRSGDRCGLVGSNKVVMRRADVIRIHGYIEGLPWMRVCRCGGVGAHFSS